jgi:hypothetical protein
VFDFRVEFRRQQRGRRHFVTLQYRGAGTPSSVGTLVADLRRHPPRDRLQPGHARPEGGGRGRQGRPVARGRWPNHHRRAVFIPPGSPSLQPLLASAHSASHEGAEKMLHRFRADFNT